jgi:hypothetical protein
LRYLLKTSRATLMADIAERLQGFAYQFLVCEGTVHFRCIEESDAMLDSLVKERDHFLFIRRCIAKAHSHTAKSKG